MKVREYPGIVMGFKDKVALVEITVPASPQGTSSTRVVEVLTARQDLLVGQQVVVLVESMPGARAATFSFILPVVLFVATFFALENATHNAGLAGLLSVFTLIPYYSILWVISARTWGMLKFRLKE